MKTLFKLTAIASVAIVLTACGGGGGGGGSVSAPAPEAHDKYGNRLGIAAPYVMERLEFVKERTIRTSPSGALNYDSGFNNTEYTERTLQEGWINGDVQAAWASGWTGKGQKIAILDDFTANDKSELSTTTVNGVTTSVPFTHGDLVSLIAGGSRSSFNFSGNAGGEDFTGTYFLDKPIYGVAKDAEIYRNDYLTHQGNGLFATMQSWSANVGAGGALWRSMTVVNLSLGNRNSASLTQAQWSTNYSAQLAIANATTNVPDAVFVKAAGNEGLSYAAWDIGNSVLATSSAYKDKTIIVGALDREGGNIASYSNRPGIGSTQPTISVRDRFLVADGTGLVGSNFEQGTSFAAPRVAGYAAIVRHKFSALDAPTTASHLLNTTKWNAAWGAKDATTQAIYGQGEASLSQALAPSRRLR